MSTIDKPWLAEPDILLFEHLGYRCAILRADPMLNLCGYVALPSGHPWHGCSFESDTGGPLVHGGITFSGRERMPMFHRDAGLWVLGFDCAHADDLMPGLEKMLGAKAFESHLKLGVVYRDMAYVRAECESLALQADEAARGARI